MSDLSQVQVKFFSKHFILPNVPIRLPGNLKRTGLSDVVNHLLSHNNKISYDFLISGNLLIGSLHKYLEKEGLSTENTLSIEVIESVNPPRREQEKQHDDWISSIDYHSSSIIAGSFNSSVYLYNSNESNIQYNIGKCVKSVAFNCEKSGFVVGTLDNTLKYYDIIDNECVLTWQGVGHSKSIESVVFCTPNIIASGSYDTEIMFWGSNPTSETIIEQETEYGKEAKRRKTGSSYTSSKKARPLFALNGHVDSVTSLTKCDAPNLIFSGGLDKSVRLWDIETKVNSQTVGCDHAVLCLDGSNHDCIVFAGHSDGIIRVWDCRSSSKSKDLVRNTLKGHTNWVTGVSHNTSNGNQLVSVSYDGIIKIWDIRSISALYSVKPKENKRLFCVKWTSDGKLICGGESGKVKIYGLNSGSSEELNSEVIR